MISGHDSQVVVSARRRLIRGTFAAPALLALHSGSAIAATSNLRCVNNQVNNPVYPKFSPSAPSDNYVRVRLWSLRPATGSSNIRWYIKGDDVDGVRLSRTSIYNSFLKVGEWQQFDPASQALVGGKLATKPIWEGQNSGSWAKDGGWLAIRVNASSTDAGIVGVVESSGGTGSGVAGSCWTSFVIAAQ